MYKNFKINFHWKTLDGILLFFFLLGSFNSIAQNTIDCAYEITTDISSITDITFQAGDTLCLMAGVRGPLYLKNIVGTAENPIVIINKGGQVIIDSDLAYGIKFAASKHVILSGAGDQNTPYGIYVRQVSNGYGLGIGDLSTDFELEKLEISHVATAGILAKTDPNCVNDADRPNFTMFNLNIHDNYIHNTGNEGMYIGSSYYLGQYISSCDKTFLPHLIDGVEIYNNRIEFTGWDAIQVGSALYDCTIHDNQIYKDSQSGETYQMSGIIVNTGSTCHVYNNRIIDGKGTGILNQGAGGQYIYNNLIVNAGRDYYPLDQAKQQFGIFSKSTFLYPAEPQFHFYNNTIINPKSDGIRIMNSLNETNRLINNLIINPGAYDYYKNLGSVNFEASDAYIHNYLDEAEISSFNHIFAGSSKAQFFADTLNYDYHLTVNSPAVNAGFDLSTHGIIFDIENHDRPFEILFDIGAYELQLLSSTDSQTKPDKQLILSPNPASDFLNLSFALDKTQSLSLKFVSMDGKEFSAFSFAPFAKGDNEKRISIAHLPQANYMIVLYNESVRYIQKFQKF